MDWFENTKQGEYNLNKVIDHYKESNNKFLTDSILDVFPSFSDAEISRYIIANESIFSKIAKFKEDTSAEMLLVSIDKIKKDIAIIEKYLKKDDIDIEPWMIDKIASSRNDINDIKMHFETENKID
jgi:hypothetical protein